MNVYEIVTDRICKALEKGVVPWKKPWSAGLIAQNATTRKPYRGINAFLLNVCTDYASPYWLTFKQALDLKGNVKKGEHGFPVVFWSERETEGDNGEEVEKIPFMRYYTVFNYEQCENLPKFVLPAEHAHRHNPVDAAEKIIAEMPARPETKTGNRAAYSPSQDVVTMPAKESFARVENFYSVNFHELVHATGHAIRLGRYKDKAYKDAAFGSADYSREELVAEMGSAFLNHEAGILTQNETMNASYISGWLAKLRADSRAVVLAAGKAQKAADYILNRKADNADFKA